ncbi:MAG TPA: glycosyltransferase family 1 protein [Bacteroidetes bacterium]|nr:glycosyltransferase family 1 protein [Bacteroidota bacterium]
MKIIYYSPHPNLNLTDPAGYGTHIREMIGAFEALGHEVLPVIMGGTSPRPSTEPPKPSLVKSIAKGLIPAKRWQTLKDKKLMAFDDEAYKHLCAEIVRFKPDLVYERANYMQNSGVQAAERYGVSHFLEMNSPYVDEKVELEGDSKLLGEARKREHEMLTKSTHIFTVSSSLRDYFLEEHGIFRGKFTVVPNAIDPQKAANAAKTEAIRQKYALEGKTVIGWVGSIQPWHGIDLLIHSFAAVAKTQPKAILMVVGSGETIAEMQALAEKTAFGKRILFTGYLPHEEVFPHISAMDICVLPNTKWYCSPIKIFEYGLMGKAIIATNHAAVLDVMEANRDGLIIESGKEALTQAMQQLLTDTTLRQKLGSTFQENVLMEHTWKANALRVLEIFESENTTFAR